MINCTLEAEASGVLSSGIRDSSWSRRAVDGRERDKFDDKDSKDTNEDKRKRGTTSSESVYVLRRRFVMTAAKITGSKAAFLTT